MTYVRIRTRVLLGVCFALLPACGADGGGGDADSDTDVDTDVDTDTDVSVDTDGDGFLDSEEAECGSDPEDVASTCYACNWRRADPGDLVATGAEVGDTIENLPFLDQCGDEVALWDFAGEYHILFLTAAW